jgi:hypothetical protein
MLDAEQLAKQRASLERLEELELRSISAEKVASDCRRESDDWRNKAESYAAELVAWRAKSEHLEATKAQSMRGLQQARDRLQNERQMMRESLQSAEASLAVKTATEQRLEVELLEEKSRMREMQRLLEGWEDKEQGWKTEMGALYMRPESDISEKTSDISDKDRKIEEVQRERDHLQGGPGRDAHGDAERGSVPRGADGRGAARGEARRDAAGGVSSGKPIEMKMGNENYYTSGSD